MNPGSKILLSKPANGWWILLYVGFLSFFLLEYFVKHRTPLCHWQAYTFAILSVNQQNSNCVSLSLVSVGKCVNTWSPDSTIFGFLIS